MARSRSPSPSRPTRLPLLHAGPARRSSCCAAPAGRQRAVQVCHQHNHRQARRHSSAAEQVCVSFGCTGSCHAEHLCSWLLASTDSMPRVQPCKEPTPLLRRLFCVCRSGIPCEPEDIVSPAVCAALYLQQHNLGECARQGRLEAVKIRQRVSDTGKVSLAADLCADCRGAASFSQRHVYPAPRSIQPLQTHINNTTTTIATTQ